MPLKHQGLSVAAITYYIVGLVSYLAKGGHSLRGVQRLVVLASAAPQTI